VVERSKSIRPLDSAAIVTDHTPVTETLNRFFSSVVLIRNARVSVLIPQLTSDYAISRVSLSSPFLYINKGNVTVRLSSEVMHIHVTTATNCRALTRCMNVSYLVGPRTSEQSSVYRVYSLSTDIMMWIC
jgi:hypothetical protein